MCLKVRDHEKEGETLSADIGSVTPNIETRILIIGDMDGVNRVIMGTMISLVTDDCKQKFNIQV